MSNKGFMKYYAVEVEEVHRPLHDVVVLILHIPERLRAEFDYNPGQHIVLRHKEEGRTFDRPYALMSSPFGDERPAIAVKRISGGVVSEYLYEYAEAGLRLQISTPQGFFYAEIPAQKRTSYFLYAGDMGIAPLFSILKSVLLSDALSKVVLFYESKDKEQTFLRRELDVLRKDFSNRFSVYHLLSNAGILTGLVSAPFMRGSLKQKTLIELVQKHKEDLQCSEHFICGSPDQIQEVQNTLEAYSVEEVQIHRQLFFRDEHEVHSKINNSPSQLTWDANHSAIEVPSNQTILEALKEQPDINPPYACEKGLCGTCAARLLEGRVQMRSNDALESNDMDKGWILTCRAYPTTEVIKLNFEDNQI